MAAQEETELDTPPPKPLPAEKRKSSAIAAWTPKVATWVKVVLDKRVKRNQALQDVPAVVSRIGSVNDPNDKTVNVLYPNKLSIFLYNSDQMPKILFAIETHPIRSIRPWEGCTAQLDQVLIHAMLHFAEQRGRALSDQRQIQVMPVPVPEAVQLDWEGSAVDGHVVQSNKIKQGLKSVVDSRAGQAAPASSSGTCAETTPVKPQTQPVPSPAELQKDFTVRISRLFQREKRDRLSRDEVRDELAAEFPTWESLLVALDAKNAIFMAEDAVFRI